MPTIIKLSQKLSQKFTDYIRFYFIRIDTVSQAETENISNIWVMCDMFCVRVKILKFNFHQNHRIPTIFLKTSVDDLIILFLMHFISYLIMSKNN